MRKTYKHAGIAGKFRLLHIAHRELILHAISQAEHLHIFIVDLPEYKRHCSLDGLEASFVRIFDKLNFNNYSFHHISENLSGQKWDEKVLSMVPNLDVMFDSKEVYGNLLVQNDFIELTISKDVSASYIEKNPFGLHEASLVAPEFWPNMLKKIAIIGDEKSGKTLLASKLAMLFNGIYAQKVSINESTIERKLVVYDNVDEINDQDVDGIINLCPVSQIQITRNTPVLNIVEAIHVEQFYQAIDFLNTVIFK